MRSIGAAGVSDLSDQLATGDGFSVPHEQLVQLQVLRFGCGRCA